MLIVYILSFLGHLLSAKFILHFTNPPYMIIFEDVKNQVIACSERYKWVVIKPQKLKGKEFNKRDNKASQITFESLTTNHTSISTQIRISEHTYKYTWIKASGKIGLPSC